MTVVEVAQWRGSGSGTAERLREGARLVAGMVPAGRRLRVDVDDDLVVTASRVRAVMSQLGDGLVVTAGGDCGVELESVAAARRKYGDRLVVLWFDAHGDLNTLASSPSGAFHGMVLRALTGEGPEGLVPEEPVRPWQIVLAGVRDLDQAEVAFVEASGVRHLGVTDSVALVDAVASAGLGRGQGGRSEKPDPGLGVGAEESGPELGVGTEGSGPGLRVGAEGFDRGLALGVEKSRRRQGGGVEEKAVYIHIDLDVLDPEVFASVGTPAPGGLLPEQLLGLVGALAERFEVAGLGIVEYEPGRLEDQELLVPLVDGLVRVCARI
ncbi:arginase family protein [Nonomuraea sp. NEAU-A123]|uniref:arginase family protein n=1 Tax=Nonomuraea sp. NEAU-A123 TaxID=2839649 RepID=UPI0027E21050|nr:arginase family protein [Nonomuraea sp. NEAU-A123]